MKDRVDWSAVQLLLENSRKMIKAGWEINKEQVFELAKSTNVCISWFSYMLYK